MTLHFTAQCIFLVIDVKILDRDVTLSCAMTALCEKNAGENHTTKI